MEYLSTVGVTLAGCASIGIGIAVRLLTRDDETAKVRGSLLDRVRRLPLARMLHRLGISVPEFFAARTQNEVEQAVNNCACCLLRDHCVECVDACSAHKELGFCPNYPTLVQLKRKVQ